MTRTRTATRRFNTDAALLWDILSDYAALDEWLPLFSKSMQLARETNFALVNVEMAGAPISLECVHVADSKVRMKSTLGQTCDFAMDWAIGADAEVTLQCSWKWTWATRRLSFHPDEYLAALGARVEAFASDPRRGPSDPATVIEIFEGEEGLMCWYRGKKYAMKAVS